MPHFPFVCVTVVPTLATIIIADTADVISLVVRLEAADGQVALSPGAGAGAGEAAGDPVPSGDFSVTGQLHQIPRGLPRALLIPLNEVRAMLTAQGAGERGRASQGGGRRRGLGQHRPSTEPCREKGRWG